jgi:hypothetical protein
MSAASPTRSTKLTTRRASSYNHSAGLPWPAGDTLTQNTPPPQARGEKTGESETYLTSARPS